MGGRGVGHVATNSISGERNDSLTLNGLQNPPYCSSMCPHCGNYKCGGWIVDVLNVMIFARGPVTKTESVP